MAIGNNNEKYYSPTYTPTTYASNDYAAQNYGDGGYWGGDYWNPDQPPVTQVEGEAEALPKVEMKKREGGEHDPNPPSGKEVERSFDNNFGYADFGMIGTVADVAGKVLGGPMGMALGAPNKLAAIDNLSAVQSARKALGLETTQVGAKNVMGAVAKGTPSHVGTVNIGGVKYDVDLDPEKQGQINPKTGIATISPKEAQTIKTENKVEMTEIAAPETPAAPKGPVGKTMQAVKDKVSSIAQSVLGNPQAATTKTVKEAVETSPVAPSTPAATPGYNPANQTQVDQATAPNTVAGRTISPGLGLANLASPQNPSNKANVSYSNIGPNRPNQPKDAIMDNVRGVVANVLGPDFGVSVTSGMENPGKQFGSPRHKTGLAVDFGITDPQGKKVTDPQQLTDVAKGLAAAGITGIGFGPGYMGGVNIHADMAQPDRPGAWGAKGLSVNMDPGLRAQLMDSMQTVSNQKNTLAGYAGIATPTARDQALQSTLSPQDQLSNVQAGFSPTTAPAVEAPAIASNPTIDSMSNVTAGIGSMTPGMSMTNVANDPTANVGVSQDMGTIGQGLAAMNAGYAPGTAMSPSNFSSIGMGYSYSPADVSKMGYALSGELGPTSLKGLMENNPEAISELAGMVSTVDNRVNSLTSVVKDNPLDAALAPSQYNSMMSTNQKTTAANYAQFGQKVNETIQGLLDGTVKATNPAQQANNYANMSISSPAWADPEQAKDTAQRTAALGFKDSATTMGSHTFGGYGLGVGAPQNAAGYGTSFGPNAATSVTGKSGLSHAPGAMYGGTQNPAGIGDMDSMGNTSASSTNALGGGLGLGGGYVDGGSLSDTGSTNSGLGGTSSSANGNTAGSGDSGASSSGNGNSAGSGGKGGSDGASGAGGGSSSGGSSGGLGGRGDNDHDGGDGRGR